MDAEIQLWLFAISTFGGAMAIAVYMFYKGRRGDQLIQGMAGICAGLITSLSLFFPWVRTTYYETPVSGFEIGGIFAQVMNVQFVRVITMFLLLFGLLIILGGFVQLTGYEIGRRIVSDASGLALLLSVIVALGLGMIPLGDIPITLEISPWIYICGAILGLVSIRLQRTNR